MSTGRYSDNPQSMTQPPAYTHTDTDFEQDIVLGNSTTLSSTLLNADQEVLSAISKQHYKDNDDDKHHKHSFSRSSSNWSKQYKKLISKASNTVVGFSTNNKQQGPLLPQYNVSLKDTSSTGGNGTRSHEYAYVDQQQGGAEDSDSDYPSDIEIDIRSTPVRRRVEVGRRARRLYGALVVCLVLFVVWMVVVEMDLGSAISSRIRS